MKRISSLVLSLVMLFVACFGCVESVLADQTFKCGDNLTATFTSSDGVMVISGTGDMYDYINKKGGHPEWQKGYLYEVERVIIEEGVTSIGNWAFANMMPLYEVVIPDSVTSIGERAFSGSPFIKGSLRVPASVESIGDNAFSIASPTLGSRLEEINVDPANKNYCSIDGILYDKEMTKLIQIPSSTKLEKIVIPDTVKTICSSSCVNLVNVKEITLPSGINHMERNVLKACKALEKVIVPTKNFIEVIAAEFIQDSENAVIYSYSDSFMKQYAELNNLPFSKFPTITVESQDHKNKSYYEIALDTTPENFPVSLPKAKSISDSEHIVYNWSPQLETVREDKTYILEETNEKHDISYSVTKEPTCSSEGVKIASCTVCGAVVEEISIPIQSDNHNYKTYTETTPATQTADGKVVSVVKCDDCGAVKSSTVTQTIPKVSTVELQKTTIGYDWYYTGKQITPYITVIDSTGNKLTRGTDYSLTYDSGRVNIGRYAIKVTFKGNYSGTKTFTFKIVKKPVTGKWIKSGNRWWYKHSDGSYTKNDWEKIAGKWYHFDKSGWMQTGWLKVSNKWYYLSSSGAMVTGWQKVSNKWYYMNSSGAMVTGWQKVNNKWYYMNSSGAMVTGWQKIGGAWYCFNSSGAMYSNQWVGNYYVDANGRRVKSR